MEERARQSTVEMALKDSADVQGDVDGFIAQYDPKTRKVPKIAAEIAQRLLAAGRAGDALGFIEWAEVKDARRIPPEWQDARLAVLDALDRKDEAQVFRWACFERDLSSEHLRACLKRLPDFQDIDAEGRARAHAAAHPELLSALAFFLNWPSLGASTRRGPASAERTCAGTAIFQRSRMASASAGVLSFPTVGPEPIRAGSFPGTSEIIKLSTGAGQAAAASCPPFTRLRCLRTTFICEIGAPEARRPALTACLSAKVSPSVGETISADSPPEIRAITRSSSVRPCRWPSIWAVAATPAASGTGWRASGIAMAPRLAAVALGTWPYRVTTGPERRAATGQASSTASQGRSQGSDGTGGLFIGKYAGHRDAGCVVDAVMYIVPAHPAPIALAGSVPSDAVANPFKSPKFLDVEVDQPT
jgi:hypothetical protein